MKLLLDENLSRRIVPFLQAPYPGSTQVALIGMERASDIELWQYAKNHDFVLVTKDSDYYDLSLIYGSPPQVIWLKTGNNTKTAIMRLLLDNQQQIKELLIQQNKNGVELY